MPPILFFFYSKQSGKILLTFMRTFFQHKLWTVFLSAVALMALTILAIGLKDFTFRPTLRFQQKEVDQVRLPAEIKEIVDQITEIPFRTHLIMWGTLLLVAVLVGFLLSPELRKRILRALLRTAIIVLALIYLLQNDKLPLLDALQFMSQTGESQNNTGLPAPPVFQPPQLSPFLVYVISLGAALLLIGLVMIVNRWWAKQKQLLADELSLDEIARVARASLDEISGGQDWENVIINCYARMSQVASKRRGLHRHASMTPSEFASRLENAGMPADAIRRLTRLFESVRYGALKSTQKENDEAVDCLTAILRYCGETV